MKGKSGGVAVGYRRVSAADQVNGYSMKLQEESIRAWCLQRNVRLLELFGDDDDYESAKDLQRPAFQRLVAAVERGGIDWVVFTKIDRLSRSYVDSSRIFATWSMVGVKLVTTEESWREGVPSGTMASLFGWIGEQERKRIVGRVIPGLRARAKSGLPPTRVPFGFQVKHDPGTRRAQRRLTQHPQNSAIIRDIFAKAALTGWGCRRLAQWASDQFAPRRFSYGRLANILSHSVYVGIMDTEIGGEHLIKTDNHEPLVDIATFLMVQQQITARKEDRKAGFRSDAESLLGGIATCALCGRSIYLDASHADPSYRCGNSETACGRNRHPQEGVDGFFFNELLVFLQHHVQTMAGWVNGAVERIPQLLDNRRRQAALMRDHVALRQQTLLERIESGVLEPDEALVEEQRNRQELAQAEALLAEVDGWTFLAQLTLATKKTANSIQFLPVPLAWAELSKPQRRRLIRTCVTKLVIKEDYPFVTVTFLEDPGKWKILGDGAALHLSTHGAIPIPQNLPNHLRIESVEVPVGDRGRIK